MKKILGKIFITIMIFIWFVLSVDASYRLKLEIKFTDTNWEVIEELSQKDIVFYELNSNWERVKALNMTKIQNDWVAVIDMTNNPSESTAWQIFVRTSRWQFNFLVSLDDKNVKEQESIWAWWFNYVFWKTQVFLNKWFWSFTVEKFLEKDSFIQTSNWETEEIATSSSNKFTLKIDKELIPWQFKITDIEDNDLISPFVLTLPEDETKQVEDKVEIDLNSLKLKMWEFYNFYYEPKWTDYRKYWFTTAFSNLESLKQNLESFKVEKEDLPLQREKWSFPFVWTIILTLVWFSIFFIIKKKRKELAFLKNNFQWQAIYINK